MHTKALLSALLATIAAAAPIVPETTPANPLLTRDLKQCSNTHLPTESLYRTSVDMYCNKFPQVLTNNIKYIYTYELKDYRGYPIKWVHSFLYAADTAFKCSINSAACNHQEMVPTINIDEAYCLRSLKKFVDGDAGCNQGSSGKMVEGGKFDGRADANGKSSGAMLWVESRQKLDDKFLPPPVGDE
jgi:hypothetical protein